MLTTEIEKSKSYILIEIIEYVADSVASKTIISKTTGDISIVAVDAGEALSEKVCPFDTFVQVIEGVAEMVIDKKPNIVFSGQGIIIPAHTSSEIKASSRLKIISTVIKSGYDEGLI